MQQEITWTVTESNGKTTSTEKIKKLPYYAPMSMKDLDEAQKNFFTKYNTMIKTLLDNDLMESK